MTFQPRTDITARTPSPALLGYISELEGKLQTLAASAAPVDTIGSLQAAFGLTRSEAGILAALADGKLRSKDQIYDALYWRRNAEELPEIKTVDVLIYKLRAKLSGFGVEITTLWGTGYVLEDTTKVQAALLGEPVARVEVPATTAIGKPRGGVSRAYGSLVEAGIAALRQWSGADGVTHVTGRALSAAMGNRCAGSDMFRRLEAKGVIEIVERPRKGGVWVVRLLPGGGAPC